MKRILNWKPVAWVRRVLTWLKPMQIPLHGAYTCFFLVLSVFPILVVLFCLLGYTSYGLEEVMYVVSSVMPDAIEPLAERIIIGAYENTSAPVLSVSILTALWSAGRGMRGLLMGLNAVYGLKENRSYFVTRGISMLYTFLFLVVLVLQTLLFAAMYAALPNRHNSLKESLPGALLTSAGWLTFSNFFSMYVAHFPNYANIYGSVYAAALAMLWLYFCICIIFYGGALNRYLMER